jgi:hypothetical protein
MNIQLRPFNAADATALQQAADNNHIAANLRNTFPVPYQLKDAEQYIFSVSERTPQTDFVIEVDGVFPPQARRCRTKAKSGRSSRLVQTSS